MAHPRTTFRDVVRSLHRRNWLADTRDPEYDAGRLLARTRLPGRGGS